LTTENDEKRSRPTDLRKASKSWPEVNHEFRHSGLRSRAPFGQLEPQFVWTKCEADRYLPGVETGEPLSSKLSCH
jgi:hypothetical protein